MLSTLLEVVGLIAVAVAIAGLTHLVMAGVLTGGVEAIVYGYCIDGVHIPRPKLRRRAADGDQQ